MTDYFQRIGRTRGAGKKLLGALSAEKMLVYAFLLRGYVAHGAEIKTVPRKSTTNREKSSPGSSSK